MTRGASAIVFSVALAWPGPVAADGWKIQLQVRAAAKRRVPVGAIGEP
jgi:hypothetical protein